MKRKKLLKVVLANIYPLIVFFVVTFYNMEIWKDIQWYEWLYQVSDLGRIKSKWRIIDNCWKWQRITKEYIMKPKLIKGGYNRKPLYKNWKYTLLYVHRLVAQAFLWLDINNKNILVCHKKETLNAMWFLDNSLNNLFLWNHKNNIEDMYKKGRSISQQKKKYLIKYWKKTIEDFDSDNNYDDWMIIY